MAARAVFAALLAAASAARAQAPAAEADGPEFRVTIAVDLSELPEHLANRVDALGLETRAVQRLLQEGFAVVAPFARPHVLLRAVEQDGAVKLVAQAGNTEEAVVVSLAAGTRAELQLELAQKLVDLARGRAHAAAEAMARAAKQEGPKEERLRPVIIPQVPPAPKRQKVDVRVFVGADALWRGAVDPLLRVGASVHGEGFTGLAVGLGYSPSGAPGVTVSEWQVSAGPLFRVFDSGWLVAHAGVMGGAVTHHFDVAGTGVVEPVGSRVDLLLSLPAHLDLRVAGSLRLGVRVAPGTTFRIREHVRDEAALWRREAARLEAGGTASLIF